MKTSFSVVPNSFVPIQLTITFESHADVLAWRILMSNEGYQHASLEHYTAANKLRNDLRQRSDAYLETK